MEMPGRGFSPPPRKRWQWSQSTTKVRVISGGERWWKPQIYLHTSYNSGDESRAAARRQRLTFHWGRVSFEFARHS